MAKVFLSPSEQFNNAYAWGDTNEGTQCGRIAAACQAHLQAAGLETKLMHRGTMAQKIGAANSWGADLYVCIHTNAFNGKVSGTRVFCYDKSGKGYQAAQKVFALLAPLTPGESESISTADFAEIVGPAAPTVYVECEFHDVASAAQWIVEHTEDIGRAIAQGVCDYFGVTEQSQNTGMGTDLLARQVLAGKWGNGAERRQRLTAAGYNYEQVQARVNELQDDVPASAAKPAEEAGISLSLRMLRRGMNGNDVRAAMVLMRDKGYYPDTLSADDELFGPRMEEGLLRMQRENELGADGVLGSASWSYLLK